MKPTRILVVEDNDLNLKLVTRVLAHHGYEFLAARNGREAIDVARREHPDLILMDIQMPDMNGLEATAILKADPTTASIPVIAVTAFAMAGDGERIVAGGCDGYIAKPINTRTLVPEIQRFLAPQDG
ncbi:MAG: response regulator [Planctomycetota bacterium]